MPKVPVDPTWVGLVRQRLLEAVATQYSRDTIQEVAYEKHPHGTWKYPVVVFAGLAKIPVARYYISYKSDSPKFELSSTQEIIQAFHGQRTPETSSSSEDPDAAAAEPSR